MTDNEWANIVNDTFTMVNKISASKGKEYTQDSIDLLANFKRAAERLELHPMKVWFVYFNKHIDSITTYINDVARGNLRPLSEPIEGRIDDAIVYLLLLQGLIKDAEKET